MPSGWLCPPAGDLESLPKRALPSTAGWAELSPLPNDPLPETWERQCVQRRKDCHKTAAPRQCQLGLRPLRVASFISPPP